MTSTTITATPSSTLRPYILRAAASVAWAILLVVAVSGRASSTPVSALAVALLVAYPLIDVVASLNEIRTRPGPASANIPLLVNTAISLVTAVALGIAAGHSAGAALGVFGIWALLTGLIQLGSAVVRRRRERRGQWPLILSGGISAVAGLAIVQMGGQTDPALTVLAGYAVAGAAFLLVSVHRLR